MQRKTTIALEVYSVRLEVSKHDRREHLAAWQGFKVALSFLTLVDFQQVGEYVDDCRIISSLSLLLLCDENDRSGHHLAHYELEDRL